MEPHVNPIVLEESTFRPEFFFKLIYKPSYCNFPENREKIKFNFYFFFVYPSNLNITLLKIFKGTLHVLPLIII